MLLKLSARFVPLRKDWALVKAGTLQKTKEVTPLPDYFFSCDYVLLNKNYSLTLTNSYGLSHVN